MVPVHRYSLSFFQVVRHGKFGRLVIVRPKFDPGSTCSFEACAAASAPNRRLASLSLITRHGRYELAPLSIRHTGRTLRRQVRGGSGGCTHSARIRTGWQKISWAVHNRGQRNRCDGKMAAAGLLVLYKYNYIQIGTHLARRLQIPILHLFLLQLLRVNTSENLQLG